MSVSASRTSSCEKSTTSAPSRAAMASRAGTRSMAITRAAPRWSALRIANSPTGPQPHTATTSSGEISQFSAAM